MNSETREFNPTPGLAETVAPGLRRILAPNPSPMTFRGTNTYLLGDTHIAVIDPGPQDTDHLAAILAALTPGQTISHIIVTHAHLDHSPLAAPLAQQTGAPIYAFGPATAGRSPIMTRLAEQGLAGGGEGIDHAFTATHYLHHGEEITSPDWILQALHTPGHIGNHLCFAWGDTCFTGDHVMGWASSLVSPPDGDLTDFMASCDLLAKRQWSCFYPGHGAPVTQANARLDWLIAHRKQREHEILDTLRIQPGTAYAIACQIYTDVPTALMGAATRNVFAHLVDLTGRGIVSPSQALESEAIFHIR